MVDRSKYGGSATSALEGKVEALKTFYDEKIDEFQEELENVDLGTIGQVQEFFPPWHPLTESDREAAEQKIDKLRENRDDLLETDGRYQRVQGMKETVRSRRNRAKNLLDDKVSSVNSLITARESEKEEAKNRIEALNRSIEQEKDKLASEGTGKRLGIFPLRRDMLDDDELTIDYAHNARIDGPRYRQRAMCETVFSTIKRTLGDAVRARTWYVNFVNSS